jgi:class 3 adenylate cyclase
MVEVEFPSGTVTFLFTDVDRSTELIKRLQEHYGAVLAQHRDLLRASFAEHGGIEVDTQAMPSSSRSAMRARRSTLQSRLS